MRIAIAYRLEVFFRWLADWAMSMQQRFSLCPDCGRNRYTGEPCKP